MSNIRHFCKIHLYTGLAVLFSLAADDVWLLPVPGCISLRVHFAAPPNTAGLLEIADHTLLWPQVTCVHTHTRTLSH